MLDITSQLTFNELSLCCSSQNYLG